MSLSKDLSVTITNESDGVVLILKTVSALGENKLSISGDHGVFDIKDLKKAIDEIDLFMYLNSPKTPTLVDSVPDTIKEQTS